MATAVETRPSLKTYMAGQLSLYASVLWESDDLVEIRALSSRPRPPERHWVEAGRPAHWAAWLTGLTVDGFDIYVSVLPRVMVGGAKREHTRPGHVVWLDVDHTAPDSVIAALQRDRRLPVPTMVVGSVNGCHCYWRLSERMVPADIEIVNRAIVGYARESMALTGAIWPYSMRRGFYGFPVRSTTRADVCVRSAA